jgi:iron complex transport system substrate-binding protein
MIAIAGGEDVAGAPGLSPAEVGWGELASLRPDVVIVMVDGYLEDVQAQAMEVWEHLESLGADRVFAVSAQAAFSDAGPRLIDGVELVGHLLHPDLMDPPGNTPFTRLRSPAPRTASA